MAQTSWPEAANRRLRALAWKRQPLAEMAVMLGRSAEDVHAQMRRLGMTSPLLY
jgi:hypothetical protein